jgi:hypothetical protein
MLSGKTILALSLFGVQNEEYRNASDTARRALFLYPEVNAEFKELQKRSKNTFYKYTGLQDDDLIYGAWVIPIVTQRITTRPFKKLKYEKENFVIRPELVYNFNNNEFSGNIVLIIKLKELYAK